jgi:hypothetical protein
MHRQKSLAAAGILSPLVFSDSPLLSLFFF